MSYDNSVRSEGWNTGYLGELLAKQSRMRALAVKRGMSAGALARLPQSHKWDMPFEIDPVLATKKHATNYNNQASAGAARAAQAARELRERPAWSPSKRAVFSFKLTLPPVEVGKNDPKAMQRAKAIVAIAASVKDMEPWQICGDRRGARFSYAKRLAMRAIREYVRLSKTGIGEALGLKFHTTLYHLAHSEALIGHHPGFQRDYNEVAKRIVARWPEYSPAAAEAAGGRVEGTPESAAGSALGAARPLKDTHSRNAGCEPSKASHK